MSGKTIAVPAEIYERVQKIATAEGTTVEELATKALERDLARRWLERVGREGQWVSGFAKGLLEQRGPKPAWQAVVNVRHGLLAISTS